jgi:hypothetical protein
MYEGRRINDIRTPDRPRSTNFDEAAKFKAAATLPSSKGPRTGVRAYLFPQLYRQLCFPSFLPLQHPRCDRYALLCSMRGTTGWYSGGDRRIIRFPFTRLDIVNDDFRLITR